MEPRSNLEARQKAAQAAHDKMLALLLDFNPTQGLAVSDVKFIARAAQTYAFDATEQS